MENDHLGRIFRRDPEETYRLSFFSGMALDMMIGGIDYKRNGEIDSAKKFFAICWAYNRSGEHEQNMTLCDQQLREIGADDEELIYLHEYGLGMVNFTMDLTNCLSKLFGKKEPFSFKEPFKFEQDY